MSAEQSHNQSTSSGGPRRWLFWGFGLIATYFLLTEHRAHVVQYLPFILLLACPLMHVFGHGGHGGHGDHASMPKDQPASDKSNKSSEDSAKKPNSGNTHHH